MAGATSTATRNSFRTLIRRLRPPPQGTCAWRRIRLPLIRETTSYISGFSTDLDGSPRLVDGDLDGTATVDMGAYEFQTYTLTVSLAGSGSGSVTGEGISCSIQRSRFKLHRNLYLRNTPHPDRLRRPRLNLRRLERCLQPHQPGVHCGDGGYTGPSLPPSRLSSTRSRSPWLGSGGGSGEQHATWDRLWDRLYRKL